MDTTPDTEPSLVDIRSWEPTRRTQFLKRLVGALPDADLVTLYNEVRGMLRHDFVKELPSEVCTKIFTYLEPWELGRCEQVSVAWRDSIRSHDAWKLQFERELSSNEDWQTIVNSARFPVPRTPRGWRLAFTSFVANEKTLLDSWRRGRYNFEAIPCRGEGIYCLQYDQDKIVSGNRDDTIKIWSLAPPHTEPLRSMGGHQGSVLCLQFDDHKIISASSDCTIRVWTLHDHKCVNVIRHHEESVLHVRFDSQRMISCSKDKSIVMWQPTDELGHEWTIFRKLSGHIAAVNVVEFDHKYIVSASGDRTIRLWDVETGDHRRTLKGHTRGIACLQYKGDHIASGSSDESIRIWNVADGSTKHVLRGHTALVRCVRFNKRFVVSGSYDTTVRLWDFVTGDTLQTLNEHSNRVFRVQFDALRIISSSQDDQMIIWEFGREVVRERQAVDSFDELALVRHSDITTV
eukprot:m.53362 g.53362  ORF g.53362 m.53362 type:complete len:461 (-) comp13553_c0_seq3:13-1395(-)